MAVTKVQSMLAKKYGQGLDKAVQAHANDDTTYGIINLPGGITNGIAQLSKCYFKEYDASTGAKKADGSSAKGEFYFRAEGTVITPESVPSPDGTIPVKGLTTSIMVNLFDTKNTQGDITTQEDQVQRILNIMRQLAGAEYTHGATGSDLETLAAGLEEAKPYFRFTTSVGKATKEYPNPRVFENWQGNKGLENYQPIEVSAFDDDSKSEVKKEVAKPSTNGRTSMSGKMQTIEVKPEPRQDNITPIPEMSVEDLVELANADADSTSDAQSELTERAKAAGYTDEEIAAEDVGWVDVAKMIENPKSDTNETEEEEEEKEEVTIPVKGQTCNYAPPGKTPGKFFAARECLIMDVNEKKKTVKLKDATKTNLTEYKDVAWDKLI